MLAIEFVKKIERFTLKNKANLLYDFARADIDASYIFKTVHKLCASYAEALTYRTGGPGGEMEIPRIGLFTEQQIRYIEDASRDINELKQSIIKIEAVD